MSQIENNVPKVIFIIPYRDREEDKEIFINQMTTNLLDGLEKDFYKIYFIRQCDRQPFNRGAMKNAGFLFIKDKYPDCYRDITLCFNDVDTFPREKGIINDYTTVRGVVKHFYGYTFALGGIVSITSGDFEYVNGFPNYYAWGYDDNMLSQRVLKAKMIIDRTVFYDIKDQRINQIPSSPIRIVNKGEFLRYVQNVPEGINTITKLSYEVDEDNLTVNVTNYDTYYIYNNKLDMNYDSSSTSPPFTVGRSANKRCSMNLVEI